MSAVYKWIDGLGTPTQSVPELVAMASDLPFTKADGSAAAVHDVVKPGELEIGLVERAKHNGVQLVAHRDMSDIAGRESEISAALKNLGRIPTSVTLGGDGARVTATDHRDGHRRAEVGRDDAHRRGHAVDREGRGEPAGRLGRRSRSARRA